MRGRSIEPFYGILYNEAKAGAIASCVCPPYDVISDDEIYRSRSPYNAVRLELPRPQEGMDRYTVARRTFLDWRENKVLVRDREKSIYIYEQEFEVEGRSYLRQGFIGLQRLDRERILTHEQTRSKAKEDRENLIRALGAYTSFPFGLYTDEDHRIEGLLGSAAKEPLFDFLDDQGMRNRFSRMSSPEEMDALGSFMDERKVYIADGHHRLDVSFRLNMSHIPFYLTDMNGKGIVVLPYHRIVTLADRRPLEELLGRLQGRVKVERVPFEGPDSFARASRRIAGAATPLFVMYSRQDRQTLYFLEAPAPAPHEGPLERLRVNILHSGILREILGIREEEISFTQEPGELLDAVERSNADLVFLLPPTTTREVGEVADRGLDMPPKSTFFFPKILTGMVFHKYA